MKNNLENDSAAQLKTDPSTSRLPGPALVEGLSFVGTGKKGSDTCPAELVKRIIEEAAEPATPKTTLGAFFAGLWMKGVHENEKPLAQILGPGALDNPASLLGYFSTGVPAEISSLALGLLNGGELSRPQARVIGGFLFGKEVATDPMRTFIATILRVRYASAEEYAGILDFIEAQYPPEFRTTASEGPPILQLAEPFDGVERSHILSPILMAEWVKAGYRVVNLVGRNPGPKFGYNLLDLLPQLPHDPLLKANAELSSSAGSWYCRQQDLSPALDRWVEIRHQMKKRPFLATLEKYLSPFKAQVLIASAFHHNFGEKMIEIAEAAGFPAALVTFKTIEGSLGMSIGRSAKIYGTKRLKDGSYERFSVEASPLEFGIEMTPDQRDLVPTLAENAKFIQSYLATGQSSSAYFDQRVQMTLKTFERAFAKIFS